MAVAASHQSSDREKTIEAIHESRVIIGHTLSTVGFQGDPQLLVIDELQFVLRPAAVTLDHRDDRRGNVIPEHHRILADRKALPDAQKHHETFSVQDGFGAVSIEYQRFEFPPLENAKCETPLLQELIGVAAADEFRLDDWTVTLYYNPYNPELERGPQVGTDDLLAQAFRRHFGSSVKQLCNFRQPSGQVPTAPPTLIAKSSFLRLVLKVLRDQILTHLQRIDPRRFPDITAIPFALQYFLMVDTNHTENGAVKDAHLCYFPLEDEIRILDEQKDVLNSAIAAGLGDDAVIDRHPVDFIRRYAWEAARSLIGYTFSTRAARYFPDWTTEPIVQVVDDSAKASIDRSIATVIMQTIRKGTNHQFNIPLFANNELVGAIIVNTQEIIPWEARVLPVWCARQVGWVIAAALTMDPQVNNMARKIAAAEARVNQVRTYQHMLQSLVHHEGSYCEMLGRLTGDLAGPDVPKVLQAWRQLIEYTSEDRRQLVSEFENAPAEELSGTADRVLAVALDNVYDKVTDVPVDEIQRDLQTMKQLFYDSEGVIRVEIDFGPNLTNRGSVPLLRQQVLRRMISNIYRNSLNVAKDRPSGAFLKFVLEIDDPKTATELRIHAKDNCGGIEDQEFPLGRITVKGWVDYLNALETRPRGDGREVHGMGFLTVARYAEATEGQFEVHNWSDNSAAGAEIIVTLGLHAERA